MSAEQIEYFKMQVHRICSTCRAYVYSEHHLIATPPEDQALYADIQDLERSFLEEYQAYINEQGFLYFDKESCPGEIKSIFPDRAQTILWFPVIMQECCHGFVCVDQKEDTGFSPEQLDSLFLLLESVGFFLLSSLRQYQGSSSIVHLSNVLDELGTFLCLVQEQTQEILYASSGLKKMFPNARRSGVKCYEAICGEDHDGSCKFCPIVAMKQGHELVSKEFFSPEFGGWLKATARHDAQDVEKGQIVVAITDISEVKQKEMAIEKVAYHDPLLEVYNRLAFTRDLSSMVEQQIKDVYALLIDIEDFKQLNDLFGFETGNVILKEIVSELELLEMRENTYRFAGGQFVVILQDSDVLQAVTLVRSFLSRFENGIPAGDQNITVNINTAIVSNKDGEFTVSNFVSKIECAIGEVKANPSNFLILGKPMEDKMKRTNLVKQVIKNTLDQGSIIVVYQPIYNIQSNCFAKAEALARIYDEDLGWVSPVEFIPLAEKMGRIHDLDMMVMERVCQQICEMKNQGIHFSSVHINISVAQLVEKDFVEQVMEVIDKYNIPHHQIELEITESTLFSSLEMGENVIKKFKAQGINAALDDFGTGYSSLDYVINLPFHSLKINMALIRHIASSEKFRKMVKYIIRIAKDFQMQTIAEGVETFEQYCILKDLGCDNIQGYYFAKPMLKDQIVEKGLTNPSYCIGD